MKDKKKILIDIPCPVSARNILAPKKSVYKYLVDAGYDVVLLAPKKAVALLEKEYGATVEPVQSGLNKRNKIQSASDFITKHLNMTQMQILCSKYGLRYNLDKKTIKAHLHFLRMLIARTLGKSRWFRLRVAPFIYLAPFRDRPMKEIFDKHKPDLVFVPNMANPEGEEFMREAKRQNIPMVGIVGSWDHPHKRFLPLQVDTMLVWSESLKEEMVTLQSYRPEQIKIVGAPHYDMYLEPDMIESRESLFKKLGLDPTKKLLTFYSCTGRAPDDGDIVDMVLKWKKEGQLNHDVQIYIRTYPGDAKGDQVKYGSFVDTPGVYVDWLEGGREFGDGAINYFADHAYMQRQISIYYHSDIAITMYSSASVESSIYGKPSINVNFDGYKQRPFEESVKRFVMQSHFHKLFDTDGVTQVNSQEEYLQAVNTILDNPDYKKNEIKKIKQAVCGQVDGNSSKRIAEAIIETLQKQESLV